MSERPEKPEPTGGTYPTQVRFTDEDKRRLDAIQDHYGFWSRTDVLRFLIDGGYTGIAGKSPEKKKRGKYQRES